jgi:hypothetical protein
MGGVSEAILHRRLQLPDFTAAYRRELWQVVERAIRRIEEGTRQTADPGRAVTKDGKMDSGEMRASVALLDHAIRGLSEAVDCNAA